MKVNRYLMPGLVIAILLGSIIVAKATGQWSVSGRGRIDVTNLTSSADVRGWMTLQQVADGFDINQTELYRIMGIPADIPPETALKDIEKILPDFEVSEAREALAAYLEGQTEASELQEMEEKPTDAPSPKAGDEQIKAAATPTPVEAEHIPQGDGSGTGPTPVPEGGILAGSDIKGRHTLQEISDQAKVPLPDLLKALGLPADIEPGTAVKDLIQSEAVPDIETVRSAVTALQSR